MPSSRFKSVCMQGLCSGLGQKLPGLELAPAAFRQARIQDVLDREIEFFDSGDLAPNLNEVTPEWEFIKRVQEKSSQSLKENSLLLSIGGDHSVSIGTVQATLQQDPKAKLVWVDAHGDINTPESSETGSLHGMPLAALIGLFNYPEKRARLLPSNLLIVGLRDLDPTERVFLKELKIKCFTAEECILNPGIVLEDIFSWLQNDNQSLIHFSFDIDALDPSLAPATGIHVRQGLALEFCQSLASLISKTGRLASMDLVEINPLQARSEEDLKKTIDCAKAILKSVIYF